MVGLDQAGPTKPVRTSFGLVVFGLVRFGSVQTYDGFMVCIFIYIEKSRPHIHARLHTDNKKHHRQRR